MRPFSLLVKPTSADCNIRFAYCFYLEKKHLYPGTRRHGMSEAVLETMIRQYFATPQPEWSFGWQGGEPTLLGREFFETIIELQERYAPPRARVSNGVQTNGTLLNDSFAKTLARGKYLVGISIDGPPEMHDRYRRTMNGEGTYREVLRGLESLRRNGVEHNVLTLVSKANVRYPREVYRHLRELGLTYHQYIPCVEFTEDGASREYCITGDEWGRFLKGVFDEWAVEDTHRVSIRNFDAVLARIVHNAPIVCTVGTHCRQYFLVEYNGDVYPCDFFVQPELRLGNILTDQFPVLWRSRVYREFGRAKKRWNERCNTCEYLKYCAGDCPRHRNTQGKDSAGLSHLCSGLRAFYAYTLDEFKAIARGTGYSQREKEMS